MTEQTSSTPDSRRVDFPNKSCIVANISWAVVLFTLIVVAVVLLFLGRQVGAIPILGVSVGAATSLTTVAIVCLNRSMSSRDRATHSLGEPSTLQEELQEELQEAQWVEFVKSALTGDRDEDIFGKGATVRDLLDQSIRDFAVLLPKEDSEREGKIRWSPYQKIDSSPGSERQRLEEHLNNGGSGAPRQLEELFRKAVEEVGIEALEKDQANFSTPERVDGTKDHPSQPKGNGLVDAYVKKYLEELPSWLLSPHSLSCVYLKTTSFLFGKESKFSVIPLASKQSISMDEEKSNVLKYTLSYTRLVGDTHKAFPLKLSITIDLGDLDQPPHLEMEDCNALPDEKE